MSASDGQTHDEWNADCIYASDNNGVGYGLQLAVSWSPYSGTNIPRSIWQTVVAYWQQAKRKLSVVTQESAADSRDTRHDGRHTMPSAQHSAQLVTTW